MQESLWFTTRSALFRPGDQVWNEVAAYAAPLSRLLERRYRWLSPEDREDLVQVVLLDMKQKLVERHDRDRGKFRALLQAVVQRRVTDLLRKRRPQPLGEDAAAALAAPGEDEVDALDLERALLEAMGDCRDRFTQGADADPAVLYALADKVVHGLSNAEIARRSGVSVDRINRLLRRAREALFQSLLRRELELDAADARLGRAVALFRATLREPGRALALLEELGDADLRGRLELFLARFRAAIPTFSSEDAEFQRGVGLVLDEDADAP